MLIRILIKALLLLIGITISSTALAGNLNINGNLWSSIKFNGTLKNPNLLYIFQIHGRFRVKKPIFKQAIFRAGFGYAINKHFSLWLGYDYIPSIDPEDTAINREQRFWQQLKIEINQNRKVSFISRTRLEQRDNLQASGISLRLRQRFTLRFTHTINHEITPTIYDEIFFNLTHPAWASKDSIDQNRLFLGFSFPTSKHTSLEIGYINQIRVRDPNNIMDNILWVSLLVNHDLL